MSKKQKTSIHKKAKNQLLSEHLSELKTRTLYILLVFILSFLSCYYYVEEIYSFLIKPLADTWINTDRRMIFTGLTEIFFSYVGLAYYSALFITIPFFICQTYMFAAPGLYKSEKSAILPFLIFSPILFLLGMIFCYYFVLPAAWKFFLSFETSSQYLINLKLEARVSEYIKLVLTMMLAFGISFQIPIILPLCTRIGIINSNTLKRKRRLAIVLIFILAALLTPPDAISQILLALPMILLYEVSILICKRIDKER